MSFIERLAPLRAQPGRRITPGPDDPPPAALPAPPPQLVAAL